MRTDAKRGGDFLLQPLFHGQRGLALGQAGAVGNAEDVRIDREGFRSERAVHHHVGGLAPHPRQAGQHVAISRNLTTEIADQDFRQGDHVFRLGIEQADGLDVLFQPLFTQRDHLRRGRDGLEQLAGRLVDADVSGLGREHDRDQQLIGIAEFQFRFRRGIVLGQAAEKFEDQIALHTLNVAEPVSVNCNFLNHLGFHTE